MFTCAGMQANVRMWAWREVGLWFLAARTDRGGRDELVSAVYVLVGPGQRRSYLALAGCGLLVGCGGISAGRAGRPIDPFLVIEQASIVWVRIKN